ncbi:hypothetical protein HPB52_024715 [Rhipicephalus sanguineus]|uniref:Uncharacterized protein n=1 Tax=Rhipicephalus sanguineus TaxID=34632 RepID=A0A9D4TDY0_RHISA|nr:hypothetical protein HPB52_024715 [Rhipicephalus sanguineus]
MQTAAAAAEEAAATIPLAPLPPQSILYPHKKREARAELQDDQKPFASTPAGSEDQTSTDSSSPTSSSSWEHNTPLTSSPFPVTLPKSSWPVSEPESALTDRAANQSNTTGVVCSIPQARRALTPPRRQPVLALACWLTGLPRRASGRREEKRVTSTGKATLDSLAQAGVSQSVTG